MRLLSEDDFTGYTFTTYKWKPRILTTIPSARSGR